MRTCVSGRERRPNKQSRATTGERSRERPSRPLLAQKLARTSLSHRQPLCLNQVTAHHARRRSAVLQHMQGSDGVRYEQSAKTGVAARIFRGFEAGLTSPAPRGARRFPLSISRTAAALPFRSALTCAQALSTRGCVGRSGAAPRTYSAHHQGLRHHQPHLVLIRVSEPPPFAMQSGARARSGQIPNRHPY